MNNAELFLIELLKLGALNATQLEALTAALDHILSDAGICAKGELIIRTNRIADLKQAEHEQKAAARIKQDSVERKYPDLSKLPNGAFGDKQ